MAIGVVKGKNVHNSRSGREYRVASGGKFDVRKLNGRLVEYQLVNAPGIASKGHGRGDQKIARIIRAKGSSRGQTRRG